MSEIRGVTHDRCVAARYHAIAIVIQVLYGYVVDLPSVEREGHHHHAIVPFWVRIIIWIILRAVQNSKLEISDWGVVDLIYNMSMHDYRVSPIVLVFVTVVVNHTILILRDAILLIIMTDCIVIVIVC